VARGNLVHFHVALCTPWQRACTGSALEPATSEGWWQKFIKLSTANTLSVFLCSTACHCRSCSLDLSLHHQLVKIVYYQAFVLF